MYLYMYIWSLGKVGHFLDACGEGGTVNKKWYSVYSVVHNTLHSVHYLVYNVLDSVQYTVYSS